MIGRFQGTDLGHGQKEMAPDPGPYPTEAVRQHAQQFAIKLQIRRLTEEIADRRRQLATARETLRYFTQRSR